jgi:uncharacterized alpha-E superfamily protein
MLSRVASSLYWMGRYLERAENVARIVIVTTEASVDLEGLDESRARAEWDDLQHSIPGWVGPTARFASPEKRAVACVESLLLDASSPVSVRTTLGRARENARSVREALTREVFEHLNEAHRDLARRGRLRDRVVALDALEKTHRSILTALGAIEHTMSRDQGWTFMKLGEAIARTLRTLLVLHAKLPSLRGDAMVDLPLHNARWRSTLRSVASLENYRGAHGGHLDADRVVRFLLFDPAAPRSVRCGLARMQGYLESMPSPSRLTAPRRIAGTLVARIQYDDQHIMDEPDLTPFCEQMVSEIRSLHEAVERQYFPF